jgi:hypothetical protein
VIFRRSRSDLGESSTRLRALDRTAASEMVEELFLDLRDVDVLGDGG